MPKYNTPRTPLKRKRQLTVSTPNKRQRTSRTTTHSWVKKMNAKSPALRKGTYKSKTKPKNKKCVKIYSPKGGPITNSLVKLHYPKTKLGKLYTKLTNPSTYESIIGQTYYSGTGGTVGAEQLTFDAASYYTGGAGGDVVSVLIPELYTGSSTTNITPGPGGFNTAQKFQLHSLFSELQLTNESVSSTIIDIYYLVSKVTDAQVYVNPDATWLSALQSEEGPNTSVATFPGATPTTAKGFNIRWRVHKKISIEMEGGQTHRARFSYKPNAIVDLKYFNDYSMVRGLTVAIMLVIRGVPTDTTSNTITAGTIQLSPFKVVGMLHNKYTTSILSQFYRNEKQVNSINTGAMTHAYVLNPEAGNVVDEGGATTVYG